MDSDMRDLLIELRKNNNFLYMILEQLKELTKEVKNGNIDNRHRNNN